MKKLLTIILIITTCLFANNIFATSNYTSSIEDRTNMFSNTQLTELKNSLIEFEEEYDISMHYIVVKDLGNVINLSSAAIQETVKFYEKTYGEIDYYNKTNNQDTIIVVLSTNSTGLNSQRWIEISCYGTVDKFISNNDVQSLIDVIYSDLSRGNYYSALSDLIDATSSHVSAKQLFNDIIPHVVIGVIAIVITAVVVWSLIYSSSAKTTVNNRTYLAPGTNKLLGRYDRFMGKTVTRTARSSGSSGGSGGGGGGGRSSGGGRGF